MTGDPWVAILRSISGNDVVRDPDEVDSLAWHVVVCRESAIIKVPVNNWVSESLDGLPDSDTVAAWFDARHIDTAAQQQVRFDQATAMAVGLNEWEAIQ